MKTTSLFAAVILLLLSTAQAFGQEYRFPDRVSYSKVRIYLLDQSRYEARDLVIERDHLSFRNLTRPGVSELELGDVDLVRAATGTRAGLYAAIAGGGSAVSAAISAAMWNSADQDVGDPALWALGFGAFGATIGYFIGRGQTTWTDVYAREPAPRSAAVSPHLHIGPGSVDAGFALTLPRGR